MSYRLLVFSYSKIYNYLDIAGRGYNPRQRRRGPFSLNTCPHIFGFYYNGKRKERARDREIAPTEDGVNAILDKKEKTRLGNLTSETERNIWSG